MTPATTTSSLLENLPNFASLFGFDHRLKALEENFSNSRQSNHKFEKSLPHAIRISFDLIDEGMRKIIKDQVKKEVSKVIPKIEKLVTDQLESEVLVRSSKEANTSHAVAANLSELELKKILIDKMEANNSINRSDIQRQLYQSLVDSYEADKILLIHWAIRTTIKDARDGADDDQDPRRWNRRGGSKEEGQERNPLLQCSIVESDNQDCRTDYQTSAIPGVRNMVVQDDKQKNRCPTFLPDWFQKPTRLPSPDHAWNTSVPAVHETIQPWLNDQTLTTELLDWSLTFELMKGHLQKFLTERRNIFVRRCNFKETSTRCPIQKDGIIAVTKLKLSNGDDYNILIGLQYEGMDYALYKVQKKRLTQTKDPRH
ncbi:hypothetical protein Tco_0503896 [Tanacetum coccineum]